MATRRPPTFARPVFAANWKMNHGPSQATAFVEDFLDRYPPRDDRTVILFPPALSLAAVRAATQSRPDVRVGVQNVFTEDRGAFTGENSAMIAADAGASFVLVGHSERRHVFGETDAQVARKCERVADHGLTPVLCVGETIEQRERGETEAVVVHQLQTGVSMLSATAIAEMIVAYEPVWAIGTGRTATPSDATTVHRAIRAALVDRIGAAAADVPILYGGSVNAGNVVALLAADEVDGVLVGGACLEPGSWTTICSVT